MSYRDVFYRYKITFVKVSDGDTFWALIDLGCNVTVKERIRLADIDTWETNQPAQKPKGQAAKAFALSWLTRGEGELWINSIAFNPSDKYGRVLATVHRGDDPVSLSDALRANGHEKVLA